MKDTNDTLTLEEIQFLLEEEAELSEIESTCKELDFNAPYNKDD